MKLIILLSCTNFQIKWSYAETNSIKLTLLTRIILILKNNTEKEKKLKKSSKLLSFNLPFTKLVILTDSFWSWSKC